MRRILSLVCASRTRKSVNNTCSFKVPEHALVSCSSFSTTGFHKTDRHLFVCGDIWCFFCGHFIVTGLMLLLFCGRCVNDELCARHSNVENTAHETYIKAKWFSKEGTHWVLKIYTEIPVGESNGKHSSI